MDEHSLSEKAAKSLGVLPAGLPRPPVRHISAAAVSQQAVSQSAVSQQPARASSCHSLTPAERTQTTRTRGTTDQPGKAHARAATVLLAGRRGRHAAHQQAVRASSRASVHKVSVRTRRDATSARTALCAVLRSSRTGESSAT